MEIRESVPNDKEPIRTVHRDAFDASESEIVSQLAVDLLEDPTALPILSLVAEQGNEIVGNIIFTTVSIKGKNQKFSAYILAPLAVAKGHQGNGIGTKLIKLGLKTLKERGADIVLVLGDPKYYSRTGFTINHNIYSPYDLEYPEAWMAQELVGGVLKKANGTIQCAISLNSPELW